jgi:hypothetical protein
LLLFFSPLISSSFTPRILRIRSSRFAAASICCRYFWSFFRPCFFF